MMNRTLLMSIIDNMKKKHLWIKQKNRFQNVISSYKYILYFLSIYFLIKSVRLILNKVSEIKLNLNFTSD